MSVGRMVTLRQIRDYLEREGEIFEIYGDPESFIVGFSAFDQYVEGTITWIKNLQTYYKIKKEEKNPALIVIDEEVSRISYYDNKLICHNPKYIFSLILREFFEEKPRIGIREGSFVSKSAILQENVSIGSGCVIEEDVIIGQGTIIYHNVVLRKGTVIGENCVIKSGTVIGEEGYGYGMNGDKIVHTPHFGHVILEDRVEIGSNCSIDRGTMGDTVIGKGSKIDNLCHVAHNVQIGRNVMIVAGSIICGSACVKDGAYIAPGGVIKNQIEIGEGCIIGMGSVVLKDVPSQKIVVGVPARVMRDVGNEDL